MRSQVAPRKDRMFFYPSNIVDDSDSDWADEEDEVSAEMLSLNALVYRERDSAKQCAFESTHGMRQFLPSEEFSPQGMVTGGSNSGGLSIFETMCRLQLRVDQEADQRIKGGARRTNGGGERAEAYAVRSAQNE